MANYKEYLIGSAPTAAWTLDTAGSTDVDLSMSGRDATVSVDDRYSVPVVGGAARGLTFESSSDTVYYPPLNIWSGNNSGVSFSVEFVIRPNYTDVETIIFAPRESSGRVPNNQISVLNNKLSFVISDDYNGGSYTERYEAYTFLDYTGDVYHCVAIYQQSSITLWVNNELVHTVPVESNFKWSHEEDATNGFETRGSYGASVLISTMAVYKRPLEGNLITAHYRAMMYRPDPPTIVHGVGTTFMLNDGDRQKSFYFSDPALNDWSEVALDNLSIINNKLSLDEIEPVSFNGTGPTFVAGSPDRISLSSSEYLKVEDADRFISSNSGAVGVYFKYESAIHGALASGELSVMSIFNNTKTSVIDVVEKSDKKIYVRYTSNNIAMSDILLASPSTGVDSENYVYVTISPEEIVAYWNTSGTSATIDITNDGGTAAPVIDSGSGIIIGASAYGDNNWDSEFYWANIWSVPRDIADMATFKDEVYEYTLKLGDSLSVSQQGVATWELDTGADGEGDETINQSRVWWAPSLPPANILVEAGTYVDMSGDIQYVAAENTQEIDSASAGANVPESVFLKATLATDDSVNDIVYLKKIGVDLIRDATTISENGADEIIFSESPKIDFSIENISNQQLHTGARIDSALSACKIYSAYTTDPLTDDPAVPESSDSAAPPTELSVAKTVEFWARLYSSSDGLIFKYNGADQHSLSYDGATRIFSVVGFDKLYIDGEEVTLISGDSAAMTAYFNNKWHHFVIVLNDAINQDDGTLFSIVSGAPTVLTDTSKFYSGEKSFKIAAGGSPGIVQLHGSTSGINTESGEMNTLSFFVYPNTGVTTITTNFYMNGSNNSQDHSVTADTWNLIERTFTNAATITTASIRVGTKNSSETIWIDGAGLVRGSDAFIRFAG